jgi:Flp pilus assembly protein TadG
MTSGGLSRVRRRLSRLGGSESGQAVVEFGMVVPLLCVLVLALFQFGKAMNYWIDLTHVANQGARLAAVDIDLSKAPYSSGMTLQQYVQQQAETTELKGADVSICFPTGSQTAGSPVTVEVSYPANFIWNYAGFIDRTITIRGKATMRLEHDATNFSASGTCS